MNQLIMALTLILGSHTGFAHTSLATNEQSCSSTQGSNLLADNKMMGKKGVDSFNQILKGGGLYALLLSMNTELPDIAKSVEFVMLFNEINSTNQILSRLLIELQKNNQLLSQNTLNQGVAMDG